VERARREGGRTYCKVGAVPVGPEHNKVSIFQLATVRHPKQDPSLEPMHQELKVDGLLDVADVP
jgi:hypothetical protein